MRSEKKLRVYTASEVKGLRTNDCLERQREVCGTWRRMPGLLNKKQLCSGWEGPLKHYFMNF